MIISKYSIYNYLANLMLYVSCYSRVINACYPSTTYFPITNNVIIVYIRITRPCNVYPLTHHFYIAKLGFTGVFVIFLIFALKHRLWELVRTSSYQ